MIYIYIWELVAKVVATLLGINRTANRRFLGINRTTRARYFYVIRFALRILRRRSGPVRRNFTTVPSCWRLGDRETP